MSTVENEDLGRILVERVCNYFLENDDWPPFRTLEVEFLERCPLGYIFRDLPPGTLMLVGGNDQRHLRPTSLQVFADCPGTDGDVARFLTAARHFAVVSAQASGSEVPTVSFHDLCEQLNLSDREATRLVLSIDAWGGRLSGGGTRGPDRSNWTFRVNPDALYFQSCDSPKSFQDAIEKVEDVRMAEAEPFWREHQAFTGSTPQTEAVPISFGALGAQSITLHRAVSDAASSLLTTGHFAEAVRAAAQRLEYLLQDATKCFGESGRTLVGKVLGGHAPLIRINSAQTKTDLDEQEGIMHLAMGIMAALRNPYSHGNPRNPTREEALEQLALVSFVFRRLESAIAEREEIDRAE